MANFYVRGSDGADADDGLSWANAKLGTPGAASAAAAGDNVFQDSATVSSAATTTTLAFAGTSSNPIKVVSVTSSGDPQPPTTATPGAGFDTTGTSSLTITGSAYFSGFTFRSGVGSSATTNLTVNSTDGHLQKYENCTLALATTGAGGEMRIGLSSTAVEGATEFSNVKLSFGQAAQLMKIYQRVRFNGGELASGTAAITTLLGNGSMGIDAVFSGVDLSRGAAAMNLVAANFGQYGQVMFRSCTLPPSWSGDLCSGFPLAGARLVMHNCSAGTTFYPIKVKTASGALNYEATVVRSGGAADTAAFSWKVTTSANASYPLAPFRTEELPAKWNTTVGSQITVTVEILADNAVGLTNEEVWLEVQYPGATSADTEFISSAKASYVAAAATLPTSTATWTTTGVTNPQKQKLSVSFTPQRAGYIQGVVCVGKASANVFVDPKFV